MARKGSGLAFSNMPVSPWPPAGYMPAALGVLAVRFCGPVTGGARPVFRGYRVGRTGKWRWTNKPETVAVSDIFPTETAAREAWRAQIKPMQCRAV